VDVVVAGEVRRRPTTMTIWHDYERKMVFLLLSVNRQIEYTEHV